MILRIVFCVVVQLNIIFALRCWVCNNAPSDSECHRRGTLQTCASNMESCQTVIRTTTSLWSRNRIWDRQTSISKMCKETSGCQENQNVRADWGLSQCNKRLPNSVCRCCCRGKDGCNSRAAACFGVSKPMPWPAMCDRNALRMDIVFILDSSSSIGSLYWGIEKKFVYDAIKDFEVSQDGVRVAAFRYNSVVDKESKFDLKDVNSKSDLMSKLQNIPYNGKGTKTGAAIQYAVQNCFTPSCGDRPDVPNVVVVVTDGKSQDQVIPAANEAQRKGVLVYGIGVSTNPRMFNRMKEEIANIAGKERGIIISKQGYQEAVMAAQNLARVKIAADLCAPQTCSPEKPEPPRNGDVVCNGMDCTFSCIPEYELKGPETVKCVNGEWVFSGEGEPSCQEIPKVCDAQDSIENGVIICSDENNFLSVCTIECDEFFRLEGDPQLECGSPESGRYEWDLPTPVCTPIPCESFGDLENGNIDCTNDNNADATCTFICDPNHTLYPPEEETSYCGASGLHSVTAKPCCVNETWYSINPCPPLPLVDIIMVVDSSSSVKTENWPKQIDFVKKMLGGFDVGIDKVRIGVFRYNKVIDTETEIKLNEAVDTATLLERIDQIPYDGSGTRTGQAMQYALDSAMTVESGNRPEVLDVFIIVTDGKSQDDVVAVSDAIRKTEADIFAIGVDLKGKGLTTLLEIAGEGNEDHAFNIEGGFDALDGAIERLNKKLEDIICNPCHRLENL